MSGLFWLLAALIAAAALAIASRPLWSRRVAAAPTAAHEVSVYKSQLAEIERDLERGVLSQEEAEGARREIARRLLAADEAMAREQAFEPAPSGEAKLTLLAFFAPLAAAALILYALMGAQGRPGEPYAARDLAQERAAALLPQAEAEARAKAAGLPDPGEPDEETAALLGRMRATLEQRPTDPEGRVLLGRALMRLQRAHEAWPLFARAAELMGEDAPPQLFAQLGEAMMLAAGGYVSREAEGAFARAPNQAISRYMLGVADVQRGDNRRALGRWTALYAEDPDAPFAAAVLDQIKRAAQAEGLDAEALAARLGAPSGEREAQGAAPEVEAEPGPTEEQRAAAAMSPEQRQEMIEGMVSGLAERLAEEPNDLPGWLRLVRAYAVLGRREEATAALETAREAFSGDADALARLAAAERALDTAPPQ